MNKRELMKQADKIGTHFCVNFPISDGVGIGSTFSVYNKGSKETWQVTRIDNVVAKDDTLIVEGRAIRKNLESSQ